LKRIEGKKRRRRSLLISRRNSISRSKIRNERSKKRIRQMTCSWRNGWIWQRRMQLKEN